MFWKTSNIIVWRKEMSKKQPLKFPYGRSWYCGRHDDSAANSFSVMALTNDVREVKQVCKVTLTSSDTAQPDRAGRQIDRRQQLLTFDLHFGHTSHVSLRVGGVAGVLSRWLRAHRVQRQDSILVNTVWQTHQFSSYGNWMRFEPERGMGHFICSIIPFIGVWCRPSLYMRST